MEDSKNTKRFALVLGAALLFVVGLVILRNYTGLSGIIWSLSRKGTWFLPLVIFSALLDSVHPCSFSILLITVAFLFGMQMSRRKILSVGAVYIAGIFTAYFSIGLGILKVLHLFNTPHFMGKLGAALLITFGAINLLNYLFPEFPIKLRLPSVAHSAMGKLINRTTVIAAFGLGMLVGICQFPCMGGPYLMVIGLLRDGATYYAGFGYLLLYNLILSLPLWAVLFVASDKSTAEKVQVWKKENLSGLRFWAGLAMVVVGLSILFFF